jgi:hypothetical protein
MEAWWALHGKAMSEQLHPSVPFSKAEKEYLEDLTGRMPIFLRILRDATLENTTQLVAEAHAPPDLADIPPRITQLYDDVCKSEEVRKVIACITEFWEDNAKQLTVESMTT